MVSSVEARRFFDCCEATALGTRLTASSGEVGERGVQFDDEEDEEDEETSYKGLGNVCSVGRAAEVDDAIDPKAGGGSVNASSREDRLGGGFGGRSTEDWGVGGRIGRGIVRAIVMGGGERAESGNSTLVVVVE